MQTNIYFVRHAHSTYTPDELGRPLSAVGFTDADHICKTLANENIDVIISSPYKRANQTVEGLAKLNGKEIFIEEGFKERTLSAKPVEDFSAAIAKVWEDPAFSWEGGESNLTAQKRGITALSKVLEMYEGNNIAIGTHGNIMVLIINFFDNKYDFNFWKRLDMPDVYKCTFAKNELIEVQRVWKRQ
ncbi:histidine phosphatase family protein [Bacillus sp. B-jedd]|uniref:histidine phosphatase family protein n=1 Tax=Bacillus sp. B-jedd TaxID=1476857 RepID=UPI00051557DB|nr:histidine phosphatase family protein [Bacillus sp. B-jedd]CEG28777.1 phosphoglycerate mutase [Bacillus sp. B-jedd]